MLRIIFFFFRNVALGLRAFKTRWIKIVEVAVENSFQFHEKSDFFFFSLGCRC
ncbi:hypothetical protein M758_5G156400 [Ceratodon purpureus]|uniref:Uncharacterized protein n=1 Tax=Ceratodon purpureus TaxID=3225 RepID=A0A8T0I3L8_CERPU|nr:hypothetical protein KC19_5G163600 [Ceratodon purpureus]KAG0616976.1 hypothetical protein M758_5G156400 [Ceratodon purpureus]